MTGHTFSIGVRSGLQASRSSTFTLSLRNHAVVAMQNESWHCLDQCWGKLLLKVMRYNIALLPKKVTNYVT